MPVRYAEYKPKSLIYEVNEMKNKFKTCLLFCSKRVTVLLPLIYVPSNPVSFSEGS
jgi:hypothetical protein